MEIPQKKCFHCWSNRKKSREEGDNPRQKGDPTIIHGGKLPEKATNRTLANHVGVGNQIAKKKC